MSAPDLFDPECEALAQHLLRDEIYSSLPVSTYEARVMSLAIALQKAYEEWDAYNAITRDDELE